MKRIEITEGESLVLVMRVETLGGTPIFQGSVLSFSVEAFDLEGETPDVSVYGSGSLEPAQGYTTELVFDDASNLLADGGGRNFLFTIDPGEYEFQGAHHYRVQVDSSLANGTHREVFLVAVNEWF